jgi:hypothetical protein
MPRDELQLDSASPSELPKVRRLLRQVFNAPENAPFINEAHLHWKCYEPREEWSGSRSFVIGINTYRIRRQGLS